MAGNRNWGNWGQTSFLRSIAGDFPPTVSARERRFNWFPDSEAADASASVLRFRIPAFARMTVALLASDREHELVQPLDEARRDARVVLGASTTAPETPQEITVAGALTAEISPARSRTITTDHARPAQNEMRP